MATRPVRTALLLLLLLGALTVAGWAASLFDPFKIELQAVNAGGPSPYQLAARINLTQGFVKQSAWLDNDKFLTLLLSPDGAAVWRTSYSTLERDKFISSSFLEQYVCSPELSTRLEWTLSPSKHYLFFSWFTDDGARQWTLIDISAAPEFKIKKFTPPPGMQIARILFSPDDRYAVLVHDSFKQGSDVSLLAMDLQQGVECWRASAVQAGFIGELWWGGAIYDSPRFNFMASLYEGRSLAHPMQLTCDLKQATLTLDEGQAGLLFGAEALWGRVGCFTKGESREGPFYIAVTIPGQPKAMQVPLSAHPVAVTLMPEPGMVLISNTSDFVTNQLWLIDALAGDKFLIDSDCAGLSVASDGKLLVRSRTNNELRIYERVAKPAAK